MRRFCGNDRITNEIKDQIYLLEAEASQYLWDFGKTQRYLQNKEIDVRHFKHIEEYNCMFSSQKEIKKWLYQRGIPFQRKIFWIPYPKEGYILTWKMLIKYNESIFLVSDELFYDRSLNWILIYDHDGKLNYGRDRIENSNTYSSEIGKTNQILKESEKIIASKLISPKFSKNPYLK